MTCDRDAGDCSADCEPLAQPGGGASGAGVGEASGAASGAYAGEAMRESDVASAGAALVSLTSMLRKDPPLVRTRMSYKRPVSSTYAPSNAPPCDANTPRASAATPSVAGDAIGAAAAAVSPTAAPSKLSVKEMQARHMDLLQKSARADKERRDAERKNGAAAAAAKAAVVADAVAVAAATAKAALTKADHKKLAAAATAGCAAAKKRARVDPPSTPVAPDGKRPPMPPYVGPPLRPSLAHVLNAARLETTPSLDAFCTAGSRAASKIAKSKTMSDAMIRATGREGWRMAREYWVANRT